MSTGTLEPRSVPDSPPQPTILRLSGLSKTFPGTKALDNVDLDIAEGEIHALVGQNGSGKSTLIKVLAGYYRADPGAQAWLTDEPFDLHDVARQRHNQLRFVHQDLGLVLELSATENLALLGGFLLDPVRRVRWRAQAAKTRELLAPFDLDLDISEPLAAATPVQRTVVAIAAALAGWEGGRGVLVLDEPTAVLPPTDVDRLLEIVEGVRKRGTSILYVSHRLDEVFRMCDRVTVLRGGKVVTTRPTKGLDTQSLAELMVGSEVDAAYRADLEEGKESPVILSARQVQGRFLEGVDVDLREGEVLGVAGLPGSGRDELPYALVGALAGAKGEIQLAGGDWLPLKKSASFDIPIVPADRGRQAVIHEFSVAENISVSVLSRLANRGWVRRSAEKKLVHDWINTIEVKAASSDALITTLSGGNQQKVMMARCLARDPRVIVLCEPTAGVDIGTRQAIYEFIADRARSGLAVLISSSDTGDLLALCTPRSRHVQRPGGPRAERGRDQRERSFASNGGDGAGMTTYQPDVSPSTGAPSVARTPTPKTDVTLLHRKTWWSRLGPSNIGAIYVLLLEIIVFSIWAPSTFPTAATVKQILDNYAITLMAALAIIVPLAARTFDLSFAYVMSLSGVAAAHFIVINHINNVALAMILGIGVAMIVGLINGFVVIVLRVDSFIGTLATGSLVTAFITYLTHDNPITSLKLNGTFTNVSQHLVGGVIVAVYWALGLAVVLWLFMEYSSTGRRLYAVGFNPEAAKLANIRVDRLRFGSLMTSATLAGFAGVMLASSISSGSPSAGTDYLLPAFAAAFVGATQFKRDRMNAWGTVVAVLMIGTGVVGLGLVNAPLWAQQMFIGVVLIAALAVTGLQQRSLWKGGASVLKSVQALLSRSDTSSTLPV